MKQQKQQQQQQQQHVYCQADEAMKTCGMLPVQVYIAR
jgi:hypothetical protein